jgi:hypothetical protein
MRPVNHVPLSLNEMKRSPLVSSRNPDSPPKARKLEVSTSPLRYSSEPKRTRVWSLLSNDAIGRALTSIATGAATENSSGGIGFCAKAGGAAPATAIPAAEDFRKRRRLSVLVSGD